jgi:hypothetical protein
MVCVMGSLGEDLPAKRRNALERDHPKVTAVKFQGAAHDNRQGVQQRVMNVNKHPGVLAVRYQVQLGIEEYGDDAVGNLPWRVKEAGRC